MVGSSCEHGVGCLRGTAAAGRGCHLMQQGGDGPEAVPHIRVTRWCCATEQLLPRPKESVHQGICRGPPAHVLVLEIRVGLRQLHRHWQCGAASQQVWGFHSLQDQPFY